MLAGKLALHDVRDTEALCVSVLRRSRLELSSHDFEDALSFLIEAAWKLSLGYQRGDRPASFSSYAAPILQRRVTDWQRKTKGRTRWTFRDHIYERPRPILVSLDSVTPELDRLGASLDPRAGDLEDGGDPAFGGLQAGGDRQRARDLDALGLEPPERAA